MEYTFSGGYAKNPKSGDIQGLKRFAQSLYLDEQQVSTRQCAHEDGMALVVDDLTEDQARRLGRAFEGNIQDVEILIHQRINFPVQTI